MKIDNNNFKNIVKDFFRSFCSIESFSFMHWINERKQQIKLILVWTKLFFFHALGLSSIKKKKMNNCTMNEFVAKVINGEWTFEYIWSKLNKNQKTKFVKKIRCIAIFNSFVKNEKTAKSFKIKQVNQTNNVYGKSECLINIENSGQYIQILCKIGNKYGLDINTHRSIYWNDKKNIRHIVAVPISIKLFKNSKQNFTNSLKIDWIFKNYKSNLIIKNEP
ncbi:hypothetical protein [Mycoplasmopsis bovigenitalium]|nr:hypothetical protein [Mycoplasmopsis bovigenitalium]